MGRGLRLFLVVLVVYLITASGRIDSGDGQAIFEVSQNLWQAQTLTIAPPAPDLIVFDAQGRPLGRAADLGIEDGYSILGRGGDFYSVYGLGHSLLILPFVALGDALSALTPGLSAAWMMAFVTALLFNPLVSALTAWVVYHICQRFEFNQLHSTIVTLLYAFATMTWPYAKTFFSDPLIALFLAFAFYCLLAYRGDRRAMWLWLAGISLGWAIFTKSASIINVPLLGLYLWGVVWQMPWSKQFRAGLIFGIPIAVGLGLVLLYNWWRFESPMDTGYRNIGWNFPFWQGVYGLIISPGKGYLLYNPVMVLALMGSFFFARRHRAELVLIGGLVVTNVVFLASYDHWHGGGSWGPRLLLQLTPFVILPLGSLLPSLPRKGPLNLGFALVVMLSVVAQIPGVAVSYARYLGRIYALSVVQYYQRVTFEVAYSPLWGQWLDLLEVAANLRDPAIRAMVAEMAQQPMDGPSLGALSTNLPDFWWVYIWFI